MQTNLKSRLILTLAALAPLPALLGQTNANTSTPPAADDQTVVMSQFEVSESGDQGYMTANAVGATLFNTPIANTPMSVVVLNSQFVSDVGAIDPVAAASYVSGVTQAGAPGSGQLTIRGQDITNGANLRDGIIDDIAPGGDMFQDEALIDRIEIIKGPEGTLYGTQSSAGGMINVVTKAPEPFDSTSLTSMVGADEFGGTILRGVLDTNGVALNDDLEYRLITVSQAGKSYQNVNDSTFVFSPMVRYKLKTDGMVLVRYIYQNPDRPINNQQWVTDAAGNISTFIPARYNDGETNATRDVKANTVDVEFTQPFSTGPIDWQARYYFRYNHEGSFGRYYNGTASTIEFLNAAGQVIGNQSNTLFSDPDFATLEITHRSVTELAEWAENASNNFDLVGTSDLGPHIKSQLLMYGQSNRNSDDAVDWAGANYPGMILWSDVPGVVANNHPTDPNLPLANAGLTKTEDMDTITTLYAVAAQENLSFFNDVVILNAGIRDDRQASTTLNWYAGTEIPDDIRKGVTHKYDIMVHPIKQIGLYYNYAQTFQPNGYTDNIVGQSVKLPNINSTIEEEGVKLNFFHDIFVVTASYFHTDIADEVVLVPEVNAEGQQVSVSVPAGQAVIKGWEADGTLVISPNWNAIFGAGNISSETQTGLAARAVPYGTNYRAWLKYQFTDTFLKGFFVGLGLQHDGPAALDSSDDAVLFPFTVWNGVAGYVLDRHWKAQVNANNIFNANYATVATNRDFIYASLPCDAALTMTYSY